MVIPERVGPLWHVSTEMVSDRQWNEWLRQTFRLCHTSSAPAPWPNLTTVYDVYTLQTKLLLIGLCYISSSSACCLQCLTLCTFLTSNRLPLWLKKVLLFCWNSIIYGTASVISANNVDTFKSRLEKFYGNQDLIFEYTSTVRWCGPMPPDAVRRGPMR